MATNGLGYYTWKGLPPEVKALGEYDGELWRAVYNAAVEQHRTDPSGAAWNAVKGTSNPVLDHMKIEAPEVFSWLPRNKQHKDQARDEHGRFEGGQTTLRTSSKKPWAVVWVGSDHPKLADQTPHIISTHVDRSGAELRVSQTNPVSRYEIAPIENGTVTVGAGTKARRQLDNDSHDSSQGGRDREPADVDNPNAASPAVAEAAGQGFNTTDPEEDTPEAHDGNPFGPKPTTDVADYNNEMAIARGNKKPNAKPQGPNPPAAL